MKIEISIGELVDKLSILEIKLLNIRDSHKLTNIYKELETLNPYFQDLLDEYIVGTNVNRKLHIIGTTVIGK